MLWLVLALALALSPHLQALHFPVYTAGKKVVLSEDSTMERGFKHYVKGRPNCNKIVSFDAKTCP